jgi:transposase
VLDLSGLYRKLNDTLGQVTQVADPFHLVRLANTKLDECRRRPQNETVCPTGAAKTTRSTGPSGC